VFIPSSTRPHQVLALTTILTGLLLAGCGSQSVPTTPAAVDTAAGVVSEAGLTRVVAVPDAQAAAEQARLHAVVSGHFGDRTILTYAAPAGLSAQSLDALPGEANDPDAFESLGSRPVWASGSVGLWAQGSVSVWAQGSRPVWASGSRALWADGSTPLWASGTYAVIPDNTAAWQSVHLQAAQAASRKLGAGVVVAVVDTGIDLNHPAFAKSITGKNTWLDLVGLDATPQEEGSVLDDAYGHGSAVAGIVLQMAPEAKILPVRVLSPEGSGDPLNVALGIIWAEQKGADIINLSLGSRQPSPLVEAAVAWAQSQGTLVVGSAGNTGTAGSEYPARTLRPARNGLNVGSSDVTGTKSDFSNYGADLSVLAPGERIGSVYPNNGLAAWTGTSMSTPVVSGELALGLGENSRRNLTQLVVTTADQAGTSPSGQALSRVNLEAFVRALP